MEIFLKKLHHKGNSPQYRSERNLARSIEQSRPNLVFGVAEIHLPCVGTKNALLRKENRRFLEQNEPFFSRSRMRRSPNYRISSQLDDTMRKWGNLPHSRPKFGGHFYGIRPSKNAHYRLAYGEFRKGSFNDGESSCVNNIPLISGPEIRSG